MGWPLAARLNSPASRTGAFYCTLYLTGAVANPFLPIWLSDRGLSAAEIGLINAAPIFAMIVINLVVGRIADRLSDWRTVIVVGSIFAAAPPFLLLVAEGYWPILVIWTLIIVPFQAIAPVVDAAAYRMSRRNGYDFGAIRAWGIVGFVVMTLIAGFVLDSSGIVAFVPLLIAVSLARAVFSIQLPLFRSHGGQHRPTYPIDAPISPLVAVRRGELWRPWFLLPLIGGALLSASHMMQLGFGALIWAEAGVPGWIIGLLWAVAPTGEIVAMIFFERISRRFPARHLMLFACLCGVLRWWGFGLEPGPWALAALQLLHMATVGLFFLGITNFIANWTSEDIAAEAQSFFVMLRQVATGFAFVGFGFLAGTMGASAYFIAAAMSGVGLVFVVISLVMMSPKIERAELKGLFR